MCMHMVISYNANTRMGGYIKAVKQPEVTYKLAPRSI